MNMGNKKYDPNPWREDPDSGICREDDIKITAGPSCDTGWYQAPGCYKFMLVIDGVQMGCETCKHWSKVLFNYIGSCGMVESDLNDKFTIEDDTAYRPNLVTKKDFICGLFDPTGDRGK